MDRVGCAKFAEALMVHAALQPRRTSPLGFGYPQTLFIVSWG
jgi:hypothetical protein